MTLIRFDTSSRLPSACCRRGAFFLTSCWLFFHVGRIYSTFSFRLLIWVAGACFGMTCFWSRNDLLLLPPETGFIEGARVIERSECTHNGFLIRPSAIRAVFDATSD